MVVCSKGVKTVLMKCHNSHITQKLLLNKTLIEYQCLVVTHIRDIIMKRLVNESYNIYIYIYKYICYRTDNMYMVWDSQYVCICYRTANMYMVYSLCYEYIID